MSQFYASIEGSRGPATRQGSKKSGITGHIRGWSVGGEVRYWHNEETGEDEVTIYLTSGSSGYGSQKLLGRFTAKDLE